MTGPIQQDGGDLRRLDALRLGELPDVVFHRRIEIDGALRITRTDRDLVHVAIRRVQQRAAVGHRDGGDRSGHVLGAQHRALKRIDGDIDLRAMLAADLFADEQHRRLVDLALADHHGAVDRQFIQLTSHRIHGGLIGRLLHAPSAKPRRRHRGAFGHAHDLQRQDALQELLRRDGDIGGHRLTPQNIQRTAVARNSIQVFSIRITCGLPLITLSRCTACKARRTASSLVA